jgi:hypothetical protein
MDIHGRSPDIVAHWKAALAERGTEQPPAEALESEPPPFRKRRRRRRRRVRPAPER